MRSSSQSINQNFRPFGIDSLSLQIHRLFTKTHVVEHSAIKERFSNLLFAVRHGIDDPNPLALAIDNDRPLSEIAEVAESVGNMSLAIEVRKVIGVVGERLYW